MAIPKHFNLEQCLVINNIQSSSIGKLSVYTIGQNGYFSFRSRHHYYWFIFDSKNLPTGETDKESFMDCIKKLALRKQLSGTLLSLVEHKSYQTKVQKQNYKIYPYKHLDEGRKELLTLKVTSQYLNPCKIKTLRSEKDVNYVFAKLGLDTGEKLDTSEILSKAITKINNSIKKIQPTNPEKENQVLFIKLSSSNPELCKWHKPAAEQDYKDKFYKSIISNSDKPTSHYVNLSFKWMNENQEPKDLDKVDHTLKFLIPPVPKSGLDNDQELQEAMDSLLEICASKTLEAHKNRLKFLRDFPEWSKRCEGKWLWVKNNTDNKWNQIQTTISLEDMKSSDNITNLVSFKIKTFLGQKKREKDFCLNFCWKDSTPTDTDDIMKLEIAKNIKGELQTAVEKQTDKLEDLVRALSLKREIKRILTDKIEHVNKFYKQLDEILSNSAATLLEYTIICDGTEKQGSIDSKKPYKKSTDSMYNIIKAFTINIENEKQLVKLKVTFEFKNKPEGKREYETIKTMKEEFIRSTKARSDTEVPELADCYAELVVRIGRWCGAEKWMKRFGGYFKGTNNK